MVCQSEIQPPATASIDYDHVAWDCDSLDHKNHSGNDKSKFHIKLSIKSQELKKMNRIESNKKIYNILDEELKKFIHSLQILID